MSGAERQVGDRAARSRVDPIARARRPIDHRGRVNRLTGGLAAATI
jgi:hypothetical protein